MREDVWFVEMKVVAEPQKPAPPPALPSFAISETDLAPDLNLFIQLPEPPALGFVTSFLDEPDPLVIPEIPAEDKQP